MTSLNDNLSVQTLVQQRTRNPGYRLAIIGTLFAAVVILLGAFTRLSDAGLGCPDWPGCYGHLLWPNSSEEIQIAESKFPHAPVATDKTWPEMVHRYFAGTLGLIILGLAFINIKYRDNQGQPLKLALGLLVLVIVQAAFGMWTVTLKLWPQVVTAHLLGGFATLSLLWLLNLRLNFPQGFLLDIERHRLQSLKLFAVVALAVVVVQIFLGGWTSSNYAALACLDFPSCHGTFFPAADYATGFNIGQHIGPNYLGGQLEGEARTAIHYTHRIGALVTTIIMVVLAIKLLAAKNRILKRLAYSLLLVLVGQLLLGASNVVFFLPLSVAVAHNGVAALLLLTVVTICFVMFSAIPASPEKNN